MSQKNRLLAQRQALAEFSRWALTSDDLDDLLYRACRTLTGAMNQRHAKVVQRLPEREKLYLRAQVGFDVTEEERWIDAGRGSSPGHAIMLASPNISNDAPGDERFEMAGFVRRAGIHSLINTVIYEARGTEKTVWGVLEIDGTEADSFDEDDFEFLQLYADLISHAIAADTVRKEREDQSNERSRLLHELQHRVKNNFTVVTSIIGLGLHRARGEEARNVLETLAERVRAIAIAHTHLTEHVDAQAIPISPYLEELVDQLSTFYGLPDRKVTIACDVDDVTLDGDRAVSVGQIAAEFISNSIKHAFDEGGGSIDLTLRRDGEHARLRLSDDGRGYDETVGEPGTGLGMSIIKATASRLGGEAAWSPAGSGTALEVRFSANAPANGRSFA